MKTNEYTSNKNAIVTNTRRDKPFSIKLFVKL